MIPLSTIGLLLLAYFAGAIPFGYLLVKLVTGQDVRDIESGRTGGTNAMRAAGFLVGLATSLLDILKSAVAVWVAQDLFPDSFWLHVMAGLFTVIGHNYSIFLLRRDPAGQLRIAGGAGGTPAVGAMVGLWWPNLFILIPSGFFIVMVIGYASLATMSLPIIGSLIFLIRFLAYDQPWPYIFSGLLSEIFILWALRPNIKRLLAGTERVVGIRAKNQSGKKDTP